MTCYSFVCVPVLDADADANADNRESRSFCNHPPDPAIHPPSHHPDPANQGYLRTVTLNMDASGQAATAPLS